MLREPDYDKILEYIGIMGEMVKKARKAKTITEKVENLGLTSEACKQLSDDFELWISQNSNEIDDRMDDEAEEPPKKSKKSKFVPKLVTDDDASDDDDDFEMKSGGRTVIEE